MKRIPYWHKRNIWLHVKWKKDTICWHMLRTTKLYALKGWILWIISIFLKIYYCIFLLLYQLRSAGNKWTAQNVYPRRVNKGTMYRDVSRVEGNQKGTVKHPRSGIYCEAIINHWPEGAKRWNSYQSLCSCRRRTANRSLEERRALPLFFLSGLLQYLSLAEPSRKPTSKEPRWCCFQSLPLEVKSRVQKGEGWIGMSKGKNT